MIKNLNELATSLKEKYIEEFKGGSSRKVLITQAQFDKRFNG